jgi:hypothetical protein
MFDVDSFAPHLLFDQFLHGIAYSPSVMLDLLISSETMFLEYLVRYVRSPIPMTHTSAQQVVATN